MKTTLIFIASIFVLLSFQAVFAQTNKAKFSQGGVCNGSAIYLPKPEYPEEAKSRGIKGTVSVQILIDENGDVESAKALSNHPLLRKEAEKAALKTKFRQTFSSGKPVKISCVLVYNFSPKDYEKSDNENKNLGGNKNERPRICTGGLCNSRATYLPQPVYPKEAKEQNISGSVYVRVSIDEEGNVTSAETCSGHPLLREEAKKAALKAKFKQTKLSGVPVKVSCMLAYSFLPDKSEQTKQTEEPQRPYIEPPIISLGVVNDKAKVLPMPSLATTQPHGDGSIEVEIKIDLQKGKVISAMAFEGHPLIRATAVKMALQAEFEPTFTEFPTIYGKGTLIYKFEDFNGEVIKKDNSKPLVQVIKGGIINGMATYLPKPEYPEEAKRNCAGGTVEVLVLVYMANGKLISAKVISGNELLKESAQIAALKAKFSSPNIDGDKDVYIKGKLIYNFDSLVQCEKRESNSKN